MTADGYIYDLAKKVGFSWIWSSAAFKGFTHIFTAGNMPGFCMGWGDFFGFSSTEKVISSQPWSLTACSPSELALYERHFPSCSRDMGCPKRHGLREAGLLHWQWWQPPWDRPFSAPGTYRQMPPRDVDIPLAALNHVTPQLLSGDCLFLNLESE